MISLHPNSIIVYKFWMLMVTLYNIWLLIGSAPSPMFKCADPVTHKTEKNQTQHSNKECHKEYHKRNILNRIYYIKQSLEALIKHQRNYHINAVWRWNSVSLSILKKINYWIIINAAHFLSISPSCFF